MQLYAERFRQIQHRYQQQPRFDRDLVCKHGVYGGSAVLKLQKSWWTNDSMEQAQNTSGIFFSVWIDAATARRGRVSYNIHALKLRELEGYAITSRDFAAEFRMRFSSTPPWPNARTDYGPLTLMEGWIPLDEDRLADDVLMLMERFVPLGGIIDELLAERRLAR